MALQTLRAMAAGGIHDQIGGGFHRYAVEPTWTVPHFEKMLYDNALLARAYLHGWRLSGDERLLETCLDTLDWVLARCAAPEGGFYAALDADSEGAEGRYYVWTVAELDRCSETTRRSRDRLARRRRGGQLHRPPRARGRPERAHRPRPAPGGTRPTHPRKSGSLERLREARAARVGPASTTSG